MSRHYAGQAWTIKLELIFNPDFFGLARLPESHKLISSQIWSGFTPFLIIAQKTHRVGSYEQIIQSPVKKNVIQNSWFQINLGPISFVFWVIEIVAALSSILQNDGISINFNLQLSFLFSTSLIFKFFWSIIYLFLIKVKFLFLFLFWPILLDSPNSYQGDYAQDCLGFYFSPIIIPGPRQKKCVCIFS